MNSFLKRKKFGITSNKGRNKVQQKQKNVEKPPHSVACLGAESPPLAPERGRVAGTAGTKVGTGAGSSGTWILCASCRERLSGEHGGLPECSGRLSVQEKALGVWGGDMWWGPWCPPGSLLKRALASFPLAAITNHHELGGLRQQRFILLVLEVRWLKLRCGAHSLQRL